MRGGGRGRGAGGRGWGEAGGARGRMRGGVVAQQKGEWLDGCREGGMRVRRRGRGVEGRGRRCES